MKRTSGYMVVIRVSGRMWTFARLGRDGLLYRSGSSLAPIKQPVIFSERSVAQAAINRTRKQEWVKVLNAKFAISTCTLA